MGNSPSGDRLRSSRSSEMIMKAQEKLEAARIRQIASLVLYHQKKVIEYTRDLESLLADDISNIDY